MPFIWLVVRLHFWFQAKGALFLEFQSIKLPVRLLKLFWPRVVKPTSSCQYANAHLQPDVLVFDDLDFNVHYPTLFLIANDITVPKAKCQVGIQDSKVIH